jgi:hypothetical protein
MSESARARTKNSMHKRHPTVPLVKYHEPLNALLAASGPPDCLSPSRRVSKQSSTKGLTGEGSGQRSLPLVGCILLWHLHARLLLETPALGSF